MINAKANRNHRPEVIWVPVTDKYGRTHMEARWELQRGARRRSA